MDYKDESSGLTRLIRASQDSHESILDILLASGANVNNKDIRFKGFIRTHGAHGHMRG